jgi:hypothetical protein
MENHNLINSVERKKGNNALNNTINMFCRFYIENDTFLKKKKLLLSIQFDTSTIENFCVCKLIDFLYGNDN